MARAFLIVLDSFGIGGAADAASFGDEGANTLGHIAEAMALNLPHMASLGLGRAAKGASGHDPLGAASLIGSFAHASEVSRGKDTITGHWEMAGVPLAFDWGYFPQEIPAFPRSLTEAIISRGRIPGLLALCHASGTAVIEDFGVEHIRTGRPIIYTSADSVIQIAAHEQHFGLQRLYEICQIARDLTYELNIGRVIARPFIGEAPGSFQRTGNRKDFAVRPPSPTLLDVLTAAGRPVISIGKIGDIFAHSGTGQEWKVSGHPALMDKTLKAIDELGEGGFAMVNFVDFDTNFGHRRDPVGYGRLLEDFDRQIPALLSRLKAGDLVIFTADHGNDPTWKGTDHTREQVPVMVYGRDMAPRDLGHRTSFADTGQSIAAYLGVGPLKAGTTFLMRG